MKDIRGDLRTFAGHDDRVPEKGAAGRHGSPWFLAFSFLLLLILALPLSSWAHGFAGKRFFPTTFEVDDPFIGDEFSILLNSVKTPDGTTNEMDIGYSKRILPNFGVEFDEPYQHVSFPDGSSASGFG